MNINSIIDVHTDNPLLSPKSEEIGKSLYQSNKFYRDLANILEHPMFKQFFNEHFTNTSKIDVILMFINLYLLIDRKLSKINPNLNGYYKLFLMDALIKNAKSRAIICEYMTRFMNTTRHHNMLTHIEGHKQMEKLTREG